MKNVLKEFEEFLQNKSKFSNIKEYMLDGAITYFFVNCNYNDQEFIDSETIKKEIDKHFWEFTTQSKQDYLFESFVEEKFIDDQDVIDVISSIKSDLIQYLKNNSNYIANKVNESLD
jgi:hypothetical protein